MDRDDSEKSIPSDDGIPYVPGASSKRRLAEFGAAVKKAMGNSATGPLIIAADVVEVANAWDEYEAEAGGKSCNDWLNDNVGQRLHFFTSRHRAVELLGEDIRRWMHHLSAIWVLNNVPPPSRDEVLKAIRVKTGRRAPLSLAKVRALVETLIGKAPAKCRHCRRCMKLEAALTDAGVQIPE